MLSIGTKVIVNVPAKEETAKMLVKFNGMESYISGGSVYRNESNSIYTFTVKHCESLKGKPFWFIRDWLKEVKE